MFPIIPPAWAAKRPEFLHFYRSFLRDERSVQRVLPRPPKGLFEQIAAAHGQNVELSTSSTWAAVDNSNRVASHCPVVLLDGLVKAVTGRLLDQSPPGVLYILHLHGPEYALSSAHVRPQKFLHMAAVTQATYSIGDDYSVTAGGIQWYGTRMAVDRLLPCDPRIAVSALRALSFSRNFHTLSFRHTALTSVQDLKAALLAVLEVCRWNTVLSALSFPPIAPEGRKALVSSVEAGKVAELWAMIGTAIWSNPRPLFTSLIFNGSYLGDLGVNQLLPALSRLYFSSQRALAPVAICLDDCGLSPRGTADLLALLCSNEVALASLQELSLGGNPWLDPRDNGRVVTVLLQLIMKATALRFLNVESTSAVLPMASFAEVLCNSPCPFEIIKLAGSAVPPEQVFFKQM